MTTSLLKTPSWPGATLLLALSLAPLLLWVPSARAFEIRVRGTSKIDAAIQSAGTALQVVGVLRDELDQPLPQRTLELEVTQAGARVIQEQIVTTMQGRFLFQRELPPGRYDVTLEFRPTEHLEGVLITKEATVSRLDPQLDLHAPELAVGTGQAINLRIRASAGGVGLAASVHVGINDLPVQSLELDPYGRGVLDLRPFLVPGRNQLNVTLPPGTYRPEISKTLFLDHITGVEFKELALSVGYRNIERGLILTGKLRDVVTGEPVRQGTVRANFKLVSPPEGSSAMTLESREALVAQRDLEGAEAFELFVPTAALPDGQWRAEVSYKAEAGQRIQAVSPPMHLDRETSFWWLNLLGVIALMLGVGALGQLLMTGRARAMLAKLFGRRRGGEAAEALELNLEQEEAIKVEPMQAPQDVSLGDHKGKKVSGVVWDPWRHRAIKGATLRFEAQGGGGEEPSLVTVLSDAQGRFSSPELSRGSWHLRAHATGFAPGVLTLKIPHDGSLNFFRLNLVAIPWKIRRFYQNWIHQVHGEDLWGRLSPREIEGAVWQAFEESSLAWSAPTQRQALRTKLEAWTDSLGDLEQLDSAHVLLSLTELVEEAYFSDRTYDERLWQLLVKLIGRMNDLQHHRSQEAP